MSVFWRESFVNSYRTVSQLQPEAACFVLKSPAYSRQNVFTRFYFYLATSETTKNINVF